MRVRKKPVEVDAVQYDGSNYSDVVKWISQFVSGEETSPRTLPFSEDYRGGIDIETLEGTMRADVGDWIIRGVQGEFYPCKPDIFEQTYEEV